MIPLEEECEDAIIAAAMLMGYHVHAERRSRTKDGHRTAIKGHKGFPDLVIVGHGRLYFVELKRDKTGIESPEQYDWRITLMKAGVNARVLFVPSGQQQFIDELKGARR